MGDLRLTGSCLCGAVRDHISANAGRFWLCHGQRCRKATGTGHAGNIILRPESVDGTAGNDSLNDFRVPEARRFATVFSGTCRGDELPRYET